MGKAFAAVLLGLMSSAYGQPGPVFDGTHEIARFDVAEFVIHVPQPAKNPFLDVQITGSFTARGKTVTVKGFADSQDGTLFRLRFCPSQAENYIYSVLYKNDGVEYNFSGSLRCFEGGRSGPVTVNPSHRRHFIYTGSQKSFFHLGYTAYHLLDPSNSDDQVDSLIQYCKANGFNKIRFLLTGYARDDSASTVNTENEHGANNPSEILQQKVKKYNYGAISGQVNHLPAWIGRPHEYDFTRMNVRYWQRVDRAVREMRNAGIIATCIFTIEKQGLPRELGALSKHELLLYSYAVSRLSAFDNVWWDLGNEHNETRDTVWGNRMGVLVKEEDPYDRCLSAHAYDTFLYPKSRWADFIITQQYGTARELHNWVLKYLSVAKPYINEEYGYEGNANIVGHSQNSEMTLRVHWAIAMAGGYATYGDYSDYVSYFYMAEPGPGKAARQLKHLRTFFEALPFDRLKPMDNVTNAGFCLAIPKKYYVVFLPGGGSAQLSLPVPGMTGRWYNPRTGEQLPAKKLKMNENIITAPSKEDWTFLITEK